MIDACVVTCESGDGSIFDLNTGRTLQDLSRSDVVPRASVALNLRHSLYVVCAHREKRTLFVYHLRGRASEPQFFCSQQELVTSLCHDAVCPSMHLFGGTGGGNILVWRISSGQLLKIFRAHRSGQKITCVSVSPDNRHLITAGEDTLIQIFRLQDVMNLGAASDESVSLPVLSTVSSHSLSVTCLHAGMTFLLSSSLDRTCIVTDLRSSSGREVASIVFPSSVCCCCLDSTERRIFAGCENGRIYEFNLYPIDSLGTRVSSRTAAALVTSLGGTSRNGGNGPRRLSVEDFHHQQQQKQSQVEDDEDEDSDLPTTDAALQRFLRSSERGHFSFVFFGHEAQVESIQLACQDTKLVSGSRDGTVIVWDLRTRQKLIVYRRQSGRTSPAVTNVSTVSVLRSKIVGGEDLRRNVPTTGGGSGGKNVAKEPGIRAPFAKFVDPAKLDFLVFGAEERTRSERNQDWRALHQSNDLGLDPELFDVLRSDL